MWEERQLIDGTACARNTDVALVDLDPAGDGVVVGTGNLKLKEFLAIVNKNGFKGSCVLEYEGDVDNPVPALVKCVEAVKKAL